MSAEKIARQGLTARHIGVVVTMALTLLTAVGIIFTAAGLCYRPVSEHFGVPVSVSYTHLSRRARLLSPDGSNGAEGCSSMRRLWFAERFSAKARRRERVLR